MPLQGKNIALTYILNTINTTFGVVFFWNGISILFQTLAQRAMIKHVDFGMLKSTLFKRVTVEMNDIYLKHDKTKVTLCIQYRQKWHQCFCHIDVESLLLQHDLGIEPQTGIFTFTTCFQISHAHIVWRLKKLSILLLVILINKA